MIDEPDDTPDDATPAPRRPRRRTGGQGATRSRAPSSPEALIRLERDHRGLQLRRAGMTWDQIARASQQEDAQPPWPSRFASAGHAYNRVMSLARSLPQQDAEEWRALLTDRAEEIYRTMAQRMRTELDTGLAARAAMAALRATRQLQLLHVPDQVQVEVSAVSDLEMSLRELERELAERADRAGNPPVPSE